MNRDIAIIVTQDEYDEIVGALEYARDGSTLTCVRNKLRDIINNLESQLTDSSL